MMFMRAEICFLRCSIHSFVKSAMSESESDWLKVIARSALRQADDTRHVEPNAGRSGPVLSNNK
jgi:hypothetical protein